MASVSLEGVDKSFRDVAAVRGLDLEIADGEMMMLVGPSGCGKTTVLRIIAGLERPDAGTVRFDGVDMDGVAPGERDIAMVFEGYALYPHLAVRDNLSFALRLRRTPPSVIDRRVADVAKAMELDHLLGRRVPGLATGEAQHVAVGRAVIREAPAVLLLDDALSHLDARQRLEARAEVARLHRELGCTIVSVTHDQAEALAVSTRLAVMNEGVLMQVGTPSELYERPADAFVAGFLGDPPMNLFEAVLEHDGGGARLRHDHWRLPLAWSPAGVTGRMVTVGIRAQDISLGAPTMKDAAGFRGRCELVEYLGSHVLVHVRVGEDEIVLLDDPTTGVSAGDLVDGHVRSDRVHLFDQATGRALEPVKPGPAASRTSSTGRASTG